MAKIDTSTIQGYAEMTAEQKLAALEALEMPDAPDMTKFVAKSDYDKLKTASDNNASEAKSWKDKYNSTLSEAERQKQAAEEAQKATNDRLAELERKDKIATAKDGYIASGFDAALALATAEAEVDGKMDVVRANIAKHTENVKATVKDEAMKGTPAPPAGGNPNPGAIDYAAEVTKALERGDYTAAAYYTRLQSEKK